MPVIKAKDAGSKIAQAEVLRFQDVEAEARRVLADARQQAEAILAEARGRAERLKADGHRAGLEAGQAEGLKLGQELGRKQACDQALADFATQHGQVARALAAALEQFEARRSGLLSEMERDVVALAGAISNRVIKRAVDVDPVCVAGNVREALQLVARRSRLEIRLHPQDLEQARRFAHELLPAEQFEAVGFVPDETVGRGGVLLRTAGGQVDATIQTQWVRILDEILAGWQEHWLLSPALLLAPQPPVGSADEPRGGLVDPLDDHEPQFVEIVQQDPVLPAVEPVVGSLWDEPTGSPVEAVVEIVSAEDAEAEAADDASQPDLAARQALIDEALSQAMQMLAQPRTEESCESDREEPVQDMADEGAIAEEIDPSEVDESDPNDAAK